MELGEFAFGSYVFDIIAYQRAAHTIIQPQLNSITELGGPLRQLFRLPA